MRKHFKNVVRDSPILAAPMFPSRPLGSTAAAGSVLKPMFSNSPLQTRMYTVAQSKKNFPHLSHGTPATSYPVLNDQIITQHHGEIEAQCIAIHNASFTLANTRSESASKCQCERQFADSQRKRCSLASSEIKLRNVNFLASIRYSFLFAGINSLM